MAGNPAGADFGEDHRLLLISGTTQGGIGWVTAAS